MNPNFIKVDHGYFIINDIPYNDFQVYVDVAAWEKHRVEGQHYALSSNVVNKIRDKIVELGNNNFVIPKGSNIYVGSGCPYAAADIRKYYNMKRGEDSGDYNIIFPMKTTYKWLSKKYAVIIPTMHIILFTDKDYSTYKEPLIGELDLPMDFILYKNVTIEHFDSFLYFLKPGLEHIMFYEGTLTKPCYSGNALNLTNENPLTLDTLRLLYAAGRADSDKESVKNYKIMLNALNQTNWRHFAGTISLINSMLYRNRYCAATYLYTHKSGLNKPERELICLQSNATSSDDLKLGQQFISELINLGDRQFVRTDDLLSKLQANHLSLAGFNKMFTTVTRIVPRNDIY